MSSTDTLEFLFAIGRAGICAFAKKSRKLHAIHYRRAKHYRRKARASKFAEGPAALLMAAGAILFSAFHAEPARASTEPTAVVTCAHTSGQVDTASGALRD